MNKPTFELAGSRTVNRVGFGAMRIPNDLNGASEILERAVELDVNFIDTAHAYGSSEQLIGDSLRPYPDDLVIATKGGLGRSGADGRPERLRSDCEESLRRLGLETIELYQLHTVDHFVPFDESMGALKELRDEGKIRHIGVSNVTTDHLTRAQSIVEVVSVQNNYSVTRRDSEEVLDWCEQRGIAFIPWFPIAAGGLARPGGPLERIAEQHDATPAQVSLAWLLHRSSVMVPIPGTSSVSHLEENVAARDLELSDDDLKQIEEAVG